MGRRIRAVDTENKKEVQIWGIEELRNIDSKDNNYDFEITTEYHSSIKAIQFFFNLKYDNPVKFELLLGFGPQAQAIEYLIEGCPLILISNEAHEEAITDINNLSAYSDVFNGMVIEKLPEQVINNMKSYKKINSII